MRNLSPSRSQRLPNLASQMRVAFSKIASKTGCKAPGDELMTRKISAVAVCCSTASCKPRLSWATSDSESSADDRRLLRGLGVFRPFGFKALRKRALAGVWPALDGFFIASTRGWEWGIVARPGSTGHGTRARPKGDYLNSVIRMRASRGPARVQPCPQPRQRVVLSNPHHTGSTRRQTHPATFLGRFSPLLEAEYLSDVADAGLRHWRREAIFDDTGSHCPWRVRQCVLQSAALHSRQSRQLTSGLR
jgi:hypothetical protein